MTSPITLYQADAVDVLRERVRDQSLACAFLDPPYNTTNTENKVPTYSTSDYMATRKWQNFHAAWDTIDDYETWAGEWLASLRPKLRRNGSVFICGSFHNIPDVAYALRATGYYTIQWIAWCIANAMPHLAGKKLGNANQTIIWARPYADTGHFYDYAAAKRHNAGKNLRDFWLIPNDSRAVKRHPEIAVRQGRKPEALVIRALDIATPKQPDSLVIDFFGGSGTTGAAARALNLPCILSDRDGEAVGVMGKRLHVQPILERNNHDLLEPRELCTPDAATA